MAKMVENNGNKKKISTPVLIIDVIVTVIFLFVFGCLLTVMIQTFTGKDPTLFGFRSFIVVSDSMTGTYDKGDVIMVKAIDGEELAEDPYKLKVGDVVTFIAPEGFGRVDGQTVTHRITEAPYEAEDGRLYIRTKGDAAAAVDNMPVPVENVTGIVLGKSEALAALQGILRSKVGFLLIIVIPLLLIAVWQIAVFAAASAKNRKKAEACADAEGTRGESEEERIQRLKKEAVEEYIKNNGSDAKDGRDENKGND